MHRPVYPLVLGVALGLPGCELRLFGSRARIEAGEIGPFVGVVKCVGGVAVLLGLATRPAAMLLVCDMLVAIVSTKIPTLLGHGFWGFADPTARHGFWSMAHESRTDLAMLLGAMFLVRVGAGRASVDAALTRRLAR